VSSIVRLVDWVVVSSVAVIVKVQPPLALQAVASIVPVIVSPGLTETRLLFGQPTSVVQYQLAIAQELPPPAALGPYCRTGWMMR
jgi:hypothetical protein